MITLHQLHFRKFLNIFLPILIIYSVIFSLEAESAGIFEPPVTDRSVEYLGMIFGGNIGGLQLGPKTVAGSSSFLGNMFQAVNSIVLTLAVIILTYTGTLSIVNTAQEGEVMGKKWSSVWIPLRSAGGLLLLAPIPGAGYSLIQVLVMWIVLNGIGAADSVWNLVVDNMSKNISPISTVTQTKQDPQVLYNTVKPLAVHMARCLICTELLNRFIPNDGLQKLGGSIGSSSTMNIDPNSDPKASGTLDFGFANNRALSNICGGFQIEVNWDANMFQSVDATARTQSNKEALVRAAYQIKVNALQSLLSDVSNVSKDLIDASLAGVSNVANARSPSTWIRNNPQALSVGILSFVNSLIQLYSSNIAIQVGATLLNINSQIQQSVTKSKAIGWLLAGSYYYSFTNVGTLEDLLMTATSEAPMGGLGLVNGLILDSSRGTSSATNLFNTAISSNNINTDLTSQVFTNYSNIFSDSILNSMSAPPRAVNSQYGSQGSILGSWLSNIAPIFAINPMAGAALSIFYGVIKNIFSDIFPANGYPNEPLVVFARAGIKLMKACETVWIVVGALMLALSIPLGLMSAYQGGFLSFFSGVAFFLPMAISLLGICWIAGCIMAIYMPLIPFLIFSLTALGWFLLVIESIIAAPIVAIGFISPSQDELGMVKPAIGMVTGIFLRPMLMLIGLFFGSKVFMLMLAMINEGFKNTFGFLNTSSSLFSWVGILALFIGLVIALEQKCYSIIHLIPDQVLRWIGVDPGRGTDLSEIQGGKKMFDQQTSGFKSFNEKSLDEGFDKLSNKASEGQKNLNDATSGLGSGNLKGGSSPAGGGAGGGVPMVKGGAAPKAPGGGGGGKPGTGGELT